MQGRRLTLGAFFELALALPAAGAAAVFFPVLGGYGHGEEKTSAHILLIILISKEMHAASVAAGRALLSLVDADVEFGTQSIHSLWHNLQSPMVATTTERRALETDWS